MIETKVEDLDPGLMAVARWKGYNVYLTTSEDIRSLMTKADPGAFGGSGTTFTGATRYDVHEILLSSLRMPESVNHTLAHEVGHVLAGNTMSAPLWSLEGRWQYFRDEVRGFEMALHLITGYWDDGRVARYAEEEAGGLRRYAKMLFPERDDM
jgi:hypothetical protein